MDFWDKDVGKVIERFLLYEVDDPSFEPILLSSRSFK